MTAELEIGVVPAASEEDARKAAANASSHIITAVSQTCIEYQSVFVENMIGGMLAIMTTNHGPRYTRMVMQAIIEQLQREN